METSCFDRKPLEGIGEDILHTLLDYIAIPGFTGTAKEREITPYLLGFLGQISYFRQNPDHYGSFEIPDDPFGRRVVWALLKKSPKKDTVVFMHHSDVVGIEDFKSLKEFAFSPELLSKHLSKMNLPEDAAADLESGSFLFGRGTADMKGGGSIQLNLLKRYAEDPAFTGNILQIIVPDEENLSAGMRGAATLMRELKEKYPLHFLLMINSEPHARKKPDEILLYEGSVGKCMPFVYLRGRLAHSGSPFQGFNPIRLLAEIIRLTELNSSFSDCSLKEVSPPPTWLYARDQKENYDVSLPLSAYGYFSVLSLQKTPGEILSALRSCCMEAFSLVIGQMNQRWEDFCRLSEKEPSPLPWEPLVLDYQELYEKAAEKGKDRFLRAYEDLKKQLREETDQGRLTLAQANFKLIEILDNFSELEDPAIIYGLLPPYYPAVSNFTLPNLPQAIRSLSEKLNSFAQEQFGETCLREHFFMGISDLSYSSLADYEEIQRSIERCMPMLGDFYSLPFSDIHAISMPCINIGPWGKDLHKLTERIYLPDLLDHTPKLIDKTLQILFSNGISTTF